MTIRILVMGLPGSGKTFLATHLCNELQKLGRTVEWFNADEVRKQFNDWDFGIEGRVRQSQRMRELADASAAEFVICDFVAPLPVMRNTYGADMTVWLDNIDNSRFKDTDQLFERPLESDYRLFNKSGERWAVAIANKLDWKYPKKKQRWYHKIFKNKHEQISHKI